MSVSFIRNIFILPIKFYRYFISPLFPPSCRFEPTCSQYAINVILEHGLIKGFYLATKRILKCHPWG
ncbi:MAG: membrane protein insertion efficiency factor YidD [SAR86 cluster bacterium]|nr:membrane protein insertion efficiency factor YidD [SAR86 cluster bacterium]